MGGNVNIALHIRKSRRYRKAAERRLGSGSHSMQMARPASFPGFDQRSSTVDSLHTNKDNVAERHAALIHPDRTESTGD